MTSDVPQLRQDLRVEEISQDNFVARVIDERFSKAILLDRVGLAVFRLVDGKRDLWNILAALEREGTRLRPSLLQKTLDFFEGNLLLEGPAFRAARQGGQEPSEVEEQRVVLQSDREDPLPLRNVYFLPEARHSCGACGMCCRGYDFGPLTEEEATRLAAEQFAEEGERLNPARKVVEKEFQDQRCKILETVDDYLCIFLAGDKKCVLHREKGPEAKPWFCQAFPLQFVQAPDGRAFGSLQMECFSHYQARKEGSYLSERVEELRHALSVLRDVPLLASEVLIGQDCTLTLEEYYRVEEWFLDRIQEDVGGPDASLNAVGWLFRHLEEKGELDNFAGPPPGSGLLSNDELVTKVADFARGRVADLRPAALAGIPEGTSPAMRRFFLEAVEFFSAEGDPERLLRVEEVEGPELDPECVDILKEFLRNEVFSKEWYRSGDLRRGLALTLVRYLVTVAGSRLLAYEWGEGRVSPKAVCHSLSMVARNLRRRRLEEFLQKEDSPLTEIYSALVEKTRNPTRGEGPGMASEGESG